MMTLQFENNFTVLICLNRTISLMGFLGYQEKLPGAMSLSQLLPEMPLFMSLLLSKYLSLVESDLEKGMPYLKSPVLYSQIQFLIAKSTNVCSSEKVFHFIQYIVRTNSCGLAVSSKEARLLI